MNRLQQKTEYQNLRESKYRIDKRCRLNDRLDIFLKNFFVFGRALQGIVRYPTTPEFPRYGEPRALLPYNVTNILNVEIDPTTYELDGIEYDFGIDKGKKILRPLGISYLVLMTIIICITIQTTVEYLQYGLAYQQVKAT